jgi:hypothetical protein
MLVNYSLMNIVQLWKRCLTSCQWVVSSLKSWEKEWRKRRSSRRRRKTRKTDVCSNLESFSCYRRWKSAMIICWSNMPYLLRHLRPYFVYWLLSHRFLITLNIHQSYFIRLVVSFFFSYGCYFSYWISHLRNIFYFTRFVFFFSRRKAIRFVIGIYC